MKYSMRILKSVELKNDNIGITFKKKFQLMNKNTLTANQKPPDFKELKPTQQCYSYKWKQVKLH